MVALPVLVDVFTMHLFPGNRGYQIKSFEDGYRIFPTTAEVINFCDPRGLDEFVHEASNVQGVDVVSDLFSFIPEDFVSLTFQVAPDQIAKESMKLDAGVVRPGEATAPKTTGRYLEISAVLLHHHICRHLRRAEE